MIGIKRIVLDSNALMMPFQFKMNLDMEIQRLVGNVEIFVPSCVLGELKRMKENEAKAALALASKYPVVETAARGDAGVLEAAKTKEAAVLTNDQDFIDILKKSSIPVIRMRSRQRLDFA